MPNMTVERALEISTLEEGKRKPAPNILSDAIETLLADEGNDHGEAVQRIRDIMNGKRKKKAPEAPKSVASTKAPAKPRAPRARKPKAEKATETVGTPGKEEAKAPAKAPKAPAKARKAKAKPEARLIPQGRDLTQFFPKNVGDLHSATQENPHQVYMFMEEENDKGEPIVTVFRVLFYSDKQEKVVLFDENTQAGTTLTAEPKEFIFTKGLFRDLVNKEDFFIEFAIHAPQEK